MNKLVFGAAAILLCVSAPADAAILNSFLNLGANLIQDDGAVKLHDVAPGGTPGVVDVGDILEEVIKFNVIEPGSIDISLSNYELTAHVRMLVTSKTPTGGTVFGLPAFNFTLTGAFADGAAAHVYEDTTPNFFREGAGTVFADYVASATDGNLILKLAVGEDVGIVEGGVDFIVTLGSPDAIAIFRSVTSATAGGNISFDLSILDNPGNVAFQDLGVFDPFPANGQPPNFWDLVGSGRIFGTRGFTTDADAFLDFVVQVNVIPEPASLVVWSGLLGGALLLRRIRRR